MTDLVLLSLSIILFHLGNKAFNMSTKFKKQTDPPSDYNQIDNPKLFLVGVSLMTLGCIVFISMLTKSLPF